MFCPVLNSVIVYHVEIFKKYVIRTKHWHLVGGADTAQ